MRVNVFVLENSQDRVECFCDALASEDVLLQYGTVQDALMSPGTDLVFLSHDLGEESWGKVGATTVLDFVSVLSSENVVRMPVLCVVHGLNPVVALQIKRELNVCTNCITHPSVWTDSYWIKRYVDLTRRILDGER